MYSFSARVRYSEVDESLFLTWPSILNLFQDCSIFQSEDLGIGVKFLKKEHRAWLLSSWQIEVSRFPKLGECLQVCTWPYDFKSMFGYRNFLLTDEEGTPLVVANSIWVHADTTTGRPTRVLPEISERYPMEPPYPMEYTARKIALPTEGTALEPISVAPAHLDSNHHVNNSQYVSMATAALPSGEYKKLRVEYKKAAQLGNRIYPTAYLEPDGYTVSLADSEGKPYAIVAFNK